MKRMIVVLLAMMLFVAGCTSNSKPASSEQGSTDKSNVTTEKTDLRKISDANGRLVEIPQEVESIVCVAVGSLRFTSYMEATDLVVGVEQNEIKPTVSKPFSYVNNDLFSTLPVTGDNGETYDEEIIKLDPDVVIAAMEKDAADALQSRLNIPVVTIPLIDNIFDEKSYDTLKLMGEVYGKEDRANELISYIKGLEEDLHNRIKDIPEKDKPRVYVGGVNFKGAHGFDGTEANYSPFSAISAKNLADSIQEKGHFNIDLEQVLTWDPEIIFLDFSGMELINEDYAKNSDYYNSLTAVKEGRIYSQIPFRFNAVNAELALANAYYTGKVIFPEQFEDVDPAKKADEIFEMMLGTKFYDTLKSNGYEFKEMKLGGE